MEGGLKELEIKQAQQEIKIENQQKEIDTLKLEIRDDLHEIKGMVSSFAPNCEIHRSRMHDRINKFYWYLLGLPISVIVVGIAIWKALSNG